MNHCTSAEISTILMRNLSNCGIRSDIVAYHGWLNNVTLTKYHKPGNCIQQLAWNVASNWRQLKFGWSHGNSSESALDMLISDCRKFPLLSSPYLVIHSSIENIWWTSYSRCLLLFIIASLNIATKTNSNWRPCYFCSSAEQGIPDFFHSFIPNDESARSFNAFVAVCCSWCYSFGKPLKTK